MLLEQVERDLASRVRVAKAERELSDEFVQRLKQGPVFNLTRQNSDNHAC